MAAKSDNSFSVYCLKDPLSKEVRYVGAAKNVNERYKEHTKWEINSEHNKPKIEWIKSLLNMGLMPEIEVIEQGLNKEDADEHEIFYIKHFKELGAMLLNMTLGGKYFMHEQHHSPETKIKMRLAAIGKPKSIIARHNMSVGKKGKPTHNKGKTKFNTELVRQLSLQGFTQRKIAETTGYEQSCVCRIINKKRGFVNI